MFKCNYRALCVRMKPPGLASVEKNGDFEGLVEPLLGGEVDGISCPQPAKSGHL